MKVNYDNQEYYTKTVKLFILQKHSILFTSKARPRKDR